MNHVAHPLQLGCVAILAAVLAGCCCSRPTQPPGPAGPGGKDGPATARLVITSEPKDELVKAGQPATFSTQAQVGADKDELSYQWLFNGVPIDPQTNATAQGKSLLLPGVSTNSVGFYSCIVTAHAKDGETQPVFEITEPGQLTVYQDGSIIVSGTPIAGAANPTGTCPRPYVGYVNFRNPNATNGGWTWDAASPVHEVVDPNCAGDRPKTQVKFWGNVILDQGCAAERVKVTRQFGGTSFVFTVFFPKSAFQRVPGAPYTLVLTGFKP
jgi:hypothetical protein